MKLLFRSLVVVLLLYGLVFAVGSALLARTHASLWVTTLFAVAFVATQYWFAPQLIEWMMNIRWDDHGSQLPDHNREFLRSLCADRRLRLPRIGIVESETPNAFTFGHVPRDANVVVTTGLLKILGPDEIDAVLAHEMGHVANWDFVIMTLAALVPLVLYEFYRAALRGTNAPANGDSNSRVPPGVVQGAYAAYLLSRCLVLLLSRTREYSADQFSARATGDPDALARALVKISYGMVRVDGEFRHAMQDASAEKRSQLAWRRKEAGSLALMGICNLRAGSTLALGDAGGEGAGALLRWDLVNPWARLYELSSTHPLTALRIRALNREAEAMHKHISHPLPADHRLRWASFPLEALLWAAPWIGGTAAFIALIGLPRLLGIDTHTLHDRLPSLLLITGVAWAVSTWFRYYGAARPTTIRELMEDVSVSQMRPRAVRLEGTIIGFGVPGVSWCPDLVLRDPTGMLYVLYRQSIPFARLLFALTSAEHYIGRKVVIEGWFRRGMRPYIEMSTLTGDDGQAHHAYSRWVQTAAAALLSVGGLTWMAFAR